MYSQRSVEFSLFPTTICMLPGTKIHFFNWRPSIDLLIITVLPWTAPSSCRGLIAWGRIHRRLIQNLARDQPTKMPLGLVVCSLYSTIIFTQLFTQKYGHNTHIKSTTALLKQHFLQKIRRAQFCSEIYVFKALHQSVCTYKLMKLALCTSTSSS